MFCLLVLDVRVSLHILLTGHGGKGKEMESLVMHGSGGGGGASALAHVRRRGSGILCFHN
jgi:hypothetical protein